MRIALCDDVKEYNSLLHNMLRNYMERNQIENCYIKEYLSGINLLKDFALGSYDFIFLDVDMPDLDGLKTAEHIRKLDLKVDLIFVTNMSDQVYTGYNYNAKGFLVKEVKQDQIDELIDRLLEELNRREALGYYKIRHKSDGGNMRLPLADILYFESKDKFILAVTEEDAFEFRGQLSSVGDDLKEKGFIRIHRSYLVNTLIRDK